MRQAGSASSSDRVENTEAGPLALSSTLGPTAEVRGLMNFREEPRSSRQTIQRASDLSDTEIYTLLDDRPAHGSFLYGYYANNLPSNQWLANDDSLTRQVGLPPRPLLQFELGDWRLPVVLPQAAVSRWTSQSLGKRQCHDPVETYDRVSPQ
jgi:hypothetical protein